MDWFEIQNVETVDSPAVLVYADRLKHNVSKTLEIAADPTLLMPHIKTIKAKKFIEFWVEAGVKACKAATIAEAELAADSGMQEILLAFPLIGPRIDRFLTLKQAYSQIHFYALIDRLDAALDISQILNMQHEKLAVYIDLNVGMNRTGISIFETEKLKNLFDYLQQNPRFEFRGFHIYEGHVKEKNIDARTTEVAQLMEPFLSFWSSLESINNLEVILGGSPSFKIHAETHYPFKKRLSPGTVMLWDAGYAENFPDLDFLPAAAVLHRVISQPTEELICTDLGHKSIAAENPVENRIRLLNDDFLHLKSQSEEHGVFYRNSSDIELGDILYALPYHICPTINLHQQVVWVQDHMATSSISIEARNRNLKY
jgi:D-serine deaminase-like pyridoxal phosphate-dependent protein